jgi:hypothetical protein
MENKIKDVLDHIEKGAKKIISDGGEAKGFIFLGIDKTNELEILPATHVPTTLEHLKLEIKGKYDFIAFVTEAWSKAIENKNIEDVIPPSQDKNNSKEILLVSGEAKGYYEQRIFEIFINKDGERALKEPIIHEYRGEEISKSIKTKSMVFN